MRDSKVMFTAAVEGIVDEAVLKRIAEDLGAVISTVHGKQGKSYLYQKRNAFNMAANFFDWIMVVDLNHSADCAPLLCSQCLPSLSPKMLFRVAVREIESWLMADREQIAKFLGVPLNKVPDNPELIENPKIEMVNLARLSSRRSIQLDMVPRKESKRSIGAAYSSRLIEFASRYWRPKVASKISNSLKSCIARIEAVAKKSS